MTALTYQGQPVVWVGQEQAGKRWPHMDNTAWATVEKVGTPGIQIDVPLDMLIVKETL